MMNEKFILAIYDGNRCVDKIRVKKSEIGKTEDPELSDYVMFVSDRVAEFIKKHK